MTKIYREAGRDIFDDVTEFKTIPVKYLSPPLHISNYQFTAEIGPISKQYMTMLSLHNPLNITFDNMVPFSIFFNSRNTGLSWCHFLLFFSRIPIFVQIDDGKTYAFNLHSMFENQFIALNSFFTQNNVNLQANLVNIQEIRRKFTNYKNHYVQNDRQLDDVEQNNICYDISYSDGRFYGVNSPQPNDWYLNNQSNPESNFNNVSAIKCVLEICMLSACFAKTNSYSLCNGGIFCTLKNGDFKFTGKFFQNIPNTKLDSTDLIYEYFYDYCNKDEKTKADVLKEVGFVFSNEAEQIKKFILTESYNTEIQENAINFIEDFSCKNLFSCTYGLEDYLKSNFALFLAGIYGHHWDYCLKYFDAHKSLDTINKEAQIFKVMKKDFTFVQHIASPLCSYCLDFKQQPEVSILLGYNLGNMGKCISTSMISISDHIDYQTKYNTRLKPVGLFPVVFQNINFNVRVKVWRSWRHLITYMKTRRQRDIIMDKLNQYGRKIFTILDPYGIFLHFHNETRGLEPGDKNN